MKRISILSILAVMLLVFSIGAVSAFGGKFLGMDSESREDMVNAIEAKDFDAKDLPIFLKALEEIATTNEDLVDELEDTEDTTIQFNVPGAVEAYIVIADGKLTADPPVDEPEGTQENLAEELDKVVAKFEEEMDKAEQNGVTGEDGALASTSVTAADTCTVESSTTNGNGMVFIAFTVA